MTTYVCPNGHRVELEPRQEPPDPDRHGNIRRGMKCDECGEKGTITSGPHGGATVTEGWDRIADDP